MKVTWVGSKCREWRIFWMSQKMRWWIKGSFKDVRDEKESDIMRYFVFGFCSIMPHNTEVIIRKENSFSVSQTIEEASSHPH